MLNVLRSDNKELRKRIRESLINIEVRPEDGYREWYKVYDTITSTELINIRSYSKKFLYTPLFSIIMPVYNAPIIFLKIAIESIINQAYQNWELCIADDLSTDEEVKILLKEYEEKDKRIKVVYRETNGHISAASNSAIDIAVGDFIVLVDQDDELPLHCLYMVALAINENKNAHILYSDEDKMDENGIRFGPYFKTDWNADLFYGQNMISHLGVYKLSLIKKVGGFRIGYEGSQDYDLALRCIEHLNPDQIHHIPHVLYHWRAIKGSTALANSNKSYAADAGFRALQDHLHRTGDLGIALENTHNSYRVKWKLPEIIPLVSIIIPTKDKLEILSACIESILKKTAYTNYEILIIDNNSTEQITHDYYYKIQQEHKRVKVYYYKKEFNFSAIINYGVQQSKGEILALLNNDTSVINEDWLTEMVSQCLRKGAGAVGAKLYYPNGQIQHAGIFLSDGHPGIHIYLKKEGEDSGYFNKLNLVQNYLAVTAACLVVKKEIFLKANGFDEENLKITYNDVDFCLKLVKLGYRNIWTPFAQLIHFDSLSRGSDFDPMNYSRFKKEHSFILKKWQHYIKNDPYFNHNLGIETLSHTYAFPPKRKYEWQTGKAQIYKSIVKI